MPNFSVTRRLSYSADQVYNIACDVDSYKEFIPLLKKSTVYNRKTLPDGRESFDAEFRITYQKLRIEETAISHVVADPVNRIVMSHSSEGAVKSMDSLWKVTSLPDGGSEVEFTIDYTLKSRSMQFLLSGMFDLAVRKVMTAFEDRARKLYGPPPTPAA